VYPIKALRGIRLEEAHLGAQGITHDRRFVVCHVGDDGTLTKMQLAAYPQCSLFEQTFVSGSGGEASAEGAEFVRVRYVTPEEPLVEARPEHDQALDVPLRLDPSTLERAELNLHQSMVRAYRVGPAYDAWFSACFGFPTTLLYIGDERRPVLGTFSARNTRLAAQKSQSQAQTTGWLASLSSYMAGGNKDDGRGKENDQDEPDWLTFSDVAPFLVATEASLRNVSQRLTDGKPMDMYKFRPNIVIDGDEAWDEDYWGELALLGEHDGDAEPIPILSFSKMCIRCASLNVDYDTGRMGQGDRGAVLKKLMADRRVDEGFRWSPVFGHYAFLSDGLATAGVDLAVGDDVGITNRTAERPSFDWPIKDPSAARFYRRADEAGVAN
jgi:uncharacterized protein YcbX